VHGFIVESDGTMEPTTDSIAIYSDDSNGDEWTHFAKVAGGSWWSKLGHDIEHPSAQALEGHLYGKVVKVLSRRS
jgi:hypothetical protein